MARFVRLLGFFLCFLSPCSLELYSSVNKIQKLFQQLQSDKTRELLSYLIAQQEDRLENIKSLAETLGELSGPEMRDPNFSVHHPLNAYRFIRNHSIIFNETATKMKQEMRLIKEGRIEIDNLLKNVTTIEVEDLKGVVRGILVIQKTYGLTAVDIANGDFGDVKVEPLTAAECQDIMAVAYLEKRYNTALEWFHVTMDKMDEEGDNMTTTPAALLSTAAAVCYEIENYQDAVLWYSKLVEIVPNSRFYKYKLKAYQKSMNGHKNTHNKIEIEDHMEQSFNDACRGNVPRLLGPVSNHLYCDYDHNGHPLLLLQPARRELISCDPYIVVYHNVLSNKSIMSIRESTESRLTRSKVMREVPTHDDKRTSHSTYDENSLPEAMKVHFLISAMTSLDMHEALQVTNYGIGGQYYLHSDYFGNPAPIDDRIATFMLYMSDVEKGGGTAFPLVPEVIYPEMGSAVFWYNLYPDNTANSATMHGACPVVIGDKWIGNVWIRRNGNEFSKPCPLDKNQKSWMKCMTKN